MGKYDSPRLRLLDRLPYCDISSTLREMLKLERISKDKTKGDPDRLDAAYHLACHRLNLGDESAISDLLNVVKERPDWPDAQITLAGNSLGKPWEHTLHGLYEDWRGRYPDNPLFELLCTQEEATKQSRMVAPEKRWGELSSRFHEFVAQHEDYPWGHYMLARSVREEADGAVLNSSKRVQAWRKALEHARVALRLNGEHPRIRLLIAYLEGRIVFFSRGNLDDAMDSYWSAFGRGSPFVRGAIAANLQNQARRELSEKTLSANEEALSILPLEAFCHRDFGILLRDLGFREDAWRHHLFAAALAESVRAEMTMFMGTFFAHYDLNIAHAEITRSLSSAKDSGQDWLALTNLGHIHMKQGETEKALECLTKATDLNPHNSGVWHNLAGVFRHMGQPDRCVELLLKATRTQFSRTFIGVLADLFAILPKSDNATKRRAQRRLARIRRQLELKGITKANDAKKYYYSFMAELRLGQMLGTPLLERSVEKTIGLVQEKLWALINTYHVFIVSECVRNEWYGTWMDDAYEAYPFTKAPLESLLVVALERLAETKSRLSLLLGVRVLQEAYATSSDVRCRMGPFSASIAQFCQRILERLIHERTDHQVADLVDTVPRLVELSACCSGRGVLANQALELLESLREEQRDNDDISEAVRKVQVLGEAEFDFVDRIRTSPVTLFGMEDSLDAWEVEVVHEFESHGIRDHSKSVDFVMRMILGFWQAGVDLLKITIPSEELFEELFAEHGRWVFRLSELGKTTSLWHRLTNRKDDELIVWRRGVFDKIRRWLASGAAGLANAAWKTVVELRGEMKNPLCSMSTRVGYRLAGYGYRLVREFLSILRKEGQVSVNETELEDLQECLGENELLLSYYCIEDYLITQKVDGNTSKVTVKGQKGLRSRLEHLVFLLNWIRREILNAADAKVSGAVVADDANLRIRALEERYQHLLDDISSILIEDLLDEDSIGKRIILSPFGGMFDLDFSSLILLGQPLLSQAKVLSVVPSLKLFVGLRRNQGSHAHGGSVLSGRPFRSVWERRLETIPQVGACLKSMTADNLRQSMCKNSWLHITTHCETRHFNADSAALDGIDDEGKIYLREFFPEKFSSWLLADHGPSVSAEGVFQSEDVFDCNCLVLEACRAGHGMWSGRDMGGFCGSFLSAGVKSVVASPYTVYPEQLDDYWNVFYEALNSQLEAGMEIDVASCLREATLSFAKARGMTKPFLWPGFQCYGL